MIQPQFSSDTPYIESVRGLLRLHELEVAGASESDEAEAVRDSLEKPWHLLTEEEQKRITGLSEDLYALSAPYKPRESNPQADCKLSEVSTVIEARKWDEALTLLRQWGEYLHPAERAHLLGQIWANRGEIPAAIVFLKHAAESAPKNPMFHEAYLHALQAHSADSK